MNDYILIKNSANEKLSNYKLSYIQKRISYLFHFIKFANKESYLSYRSIITGSQFRTKITLLLSFEINF